ncbi:MAG: pyruvate kinase [Candidatus Omnitrophica bacterium]|nr:pyruvate kinase [Candidatus Omnitrophota bacterium]
MPKTKIVCTLGPASAGRSVLLKMMRAGMDVVRLNFSHGTLAEHQEKIDIIRELNQKYRRDIKILGDLEGYRVRIGQLKDPQGIMIKKGQEVLLTNKNVVGQSSILPFDYDGPLGQIKKGSYIFIDDGNIALIVQGHSKNTLRAKVFVGGVVKQGKGINIPDVHLQFKGFADKDLINLKFSLKNKIDFVAQSFVRSKKDIANLKKHIPKNGHQPLLIAKVEDREGVRNLTSIMDACAGILIARGDLGVSVPLYEVPIIQKQIIRQCNRSWKIVMTATQMLESMTENLRPTRAEVSDVANAILDGTNYVMLSGETAVGAYPVECVDMMNKIICYAEQHR